MASVPPQEDTAVWFREDRVLAAMQKALNETIETHGNKAKAIAWDVHSAFRRLLKDGSDG